jgi:3-hydroxyisobutyrate dehydrogenase-like beta-hydroxyacid dehydrogenase
VAHLAFVGLGAMGSRLARRLLAAGHRVTGWNRTAGKARDLVAAGLTPAPAPRAAAAGAEAVSVVRELEAPVTARGAALLDVPVSGSTITVEQGQASFVAGGDAAAVERVRPWLLAMGTAVTHVGPLGLAKTMKVATNLGLAVQMLAFSEAVLLAEKAGIARERAVEALLKSVIASPMVKYRGPFVLGQMPTDAWFKVGMIQKDLQLALDAAREAGVPLPLTAVVQEWMTAARGMGLGDYDFAIVFDVLARLAGAAPSVKPAGDPVRPGG